MKRYRFIFLFLLFSFIACKSKDQAQSENDLDAARNFIRWALDGKFNEARAYLLPDSVNVNWMDIAERNYLKADIHTKTGYRSSSINIHEVARPNDSNTIVIYSNSFMQNHDTLRVIKEKGKWLIDLKYLYQHSVDTIPALPVIKDTTH